MILVLTPLPIVGEAGWRSGWATRGSWKQPAAAVADDSALADLSPAPGQGEPPGWTRQPSIRRLVYAGSSPPKRDRGVVRSGGRRAIYIGGAAFLVVFAFFMLLGTRDAGLITLAILLA
jgi:hypothetical protein